MPAIESPVAPAPARVRNDAIDIVRGLVMVIMALDHARDFVMGFGGGNPTDPATTTVPLFFTRWITHFCAPVFVLLAGVGAGLARKKKSAPELARFLVTRGLWLVLLEVTVVRAGWLLNLNYHFVVFQVIWAIGWSMVLLAPFVYLPPLAAGLWGGALILGHDLLDGVHAANLGWYWNILHEQGQLHPSQWTTIWLAYPLIPWIGVMAAGYALGCTLPADAVARRRLFARLGAGFTVAFVILRAINHYADPQAWSVQPRGPVFTVLSFLNCSKYPPSLDYLLMTIGPALLLIAALELRPLNPFTTWMRTFGRVPMFYYLCHLYVLHLVSIVCFIPFWKDPAFRAKILETGSPGWGLGATYLVWIVAVVALYPACRWFAGVKQRSRNPWLSYL
jgi:uncharacterized membrane protein